MGARHPQLGARGPLDPQCLASALKALQTLHQGEGVLWIIEAPFERRTLAAQKWYRVE